MHVGVTYMHVGVIEKDFDIIVCAYEIILISYYICVQYVPTILNHLFIESSIRIYKKYIHMFISLNLFYNFLRILIIFYIIFYFVIK